MQCTLGPRSARWGAPSARWGPRSAHALSGNWCIAFPRARPSLAARLFAKSSSWLADISMFMCIKISRPALVRLRQWGEGKGEGSGRRSRRRSASVMSTNSGTKAAVTLIFPSVSFVFEKKKRKKERQKKNNKAWLFNYRFTLMCLRYP